MRARIEHVFAEQQASMGPFVRTIGLARATTKIGLANLVHDMRRLVRLERQAALGWGRGDGEPPPPAITDDRAARPAPPSVQRCPQLDRHVSPATVEKP